MNDESLRRGLEQVARGEIRQRDDLLAITLTDFLLARIAEDEERAKAARGWQTGSRHEGQPLDWSIHMDRWSPDRVLAECEAKRRIIQASEEWRGDRVGCHAAFNEGQACNVWDAFIREMAAIYADHPDHREEWAL